MNTATEKSTRLWGERIDEFKHRYKDGELVGLRAGDVVMMMEEIVRLRNELSAAEQALENYDLGGA